MNPEVATLVSTLETRTRQLLILYREQRDRLALLEQQLQEQQLQCKDLQQENTALQKKYDILKMAKLMDMADDDDFRSVRKRLNKMIASVDKCLATLKVQD